MVPFKADKGFNAISTKELNLPKHQPIHHAENCLETTAAMQRTAVGAYFRMALTYLMCGYLASLLQDTKAWKVQEMR